MDSVMNAFYNSIKDKKPEALKNIEVKEAVAEEVVVKTVNGKKKTTTRKVKRKVAGKRKKNTRKTPTPSKPLTKVTVSTIAREIRKPGETWKEVLARATEVFRDRKNDQKAKSQKALAELRDFMKSDKYLKGWPRTYGKEKPDNDLERDLSRKALAPGRRISKKTGKVYYENRDNRSDREANAFPRKIYLKEGGELMAPTRSLFELGGEVNVEPTILQNNPNYLASTESMDSMFAKGGKLKYDPKRDVEAIVIVDGPFNIMIMKGDFIGGAYQMEQGGLAKDYTYVSPRKVIFARLKSGEDIKPVNGFWVKKNATGTVYTGGKPKKAFSKISKFKVPRPINVTGAPSKNEKIMKLLGEFSGKDFIRPGQSFVKVKDGQLVSTNAHYMIRLIDKSTEGVDELVCESRACKGLSKDERYPNFEAVLDSVSVDYSESYNLVDLYEQLMAGRENVYAEMGRRSKSTYIVTRLKLKNNVLTFDSGLLLQCVKGALELGWKNAFISYQDAKNKAIVLTEDKLATGTSNRVLAERDLILLMPIMSYTGNFEYEFDAEAEEAFELGGEVMVQPTILQNNPDYITSTATMGEWFEKGGMVNPRGYSVEWLEDNETFQREFFDTLDEAKIFFRFIIREYEYGYKMPISLTSLKDGRILMGEEFAKGGRVDEKEFFESAKRESREMKIERLMSEKAYERSFLEKMPDSKLKALYDSEFFYEDERFEKGGKIGFEGLARKVAKRYEGKPVPSDYQSEYGKTYSKDEAMEVGRKVAAKVYRQQQAKMAKGGSVSSSDKAWAVKVMLDDKEVDNFMVRARSLKEARELIEDYHEDKMEAKYGDDIYFAIEEAMAKGGALYHRLMPGDEVLEIYKDYLIIENDDDFIYVIDFRPEVAKRIQVEEIEGENTIEAAKRVADRDFEYSKYAMGGSLYTHGLEEGDLIVEDEGAYINVLSEDGKIYYVDLGRGERSTEPPLPFEHGGKVKVKAYNIATLSAKYGKKPEVVLEALREGADVEQEHTSDRKEAMRIAFDHLQEDFFYYPKLKAAEGGVDFEDYYEKGGQVPEQFLDSKGERKIDPKSIEELTDYVMALPQTKSIYFNEEAGEYVPSRRKLHADIINTFKNEVVCITEGKPIAIFMGGSPASGKSSFLRKYSPYLLKEEILKVDADEIRAMLPEYEGYNAAQTHLETKDIVNTLLSDRNIGIPCDFDLIYDGTMNSVKSYIPLMDILRKRGYKIFIVYMDNVDRDVIIKRALERYQKSGRFVPLEVIEDFFEKGKTAFNQLKKDVDGYMVVDGSSQDYKIIEQGGIKLPQNREYSKLGTKIDPKDIPVAYKKGGKTKKA
jgi:predicted ABC-type ATPase